MTNNSNLLSKINNFIRIIILAIAILLNPGLNYSQNGEWVWANDFIPYDFSLYEFNSEVLVFGSYFSDSTWNYPPLYPQSINTATLLGLNDIQGNWSWSDCYGTNIFNGSSTFGDAVVGSTGNIYSSVMYFSPYVFNGDTIFEEICGARPEVIIYNHDGNGNEIWSKRLFADTTSTNTLNHVWANYMCGDSDGNIYLSGVYNGEIIFGDTIIISHYPISNFICKLNFDGNFLWINEYSSSLMGANIFYNSVSDKIILYDGCNPGSVLGNDTLTDDELTLSYFASVNPTSGQFETLRFLPGSTSGSSITYDIIQADQSGNNYIITNIYDTVSVNGNQIICDGNDFILWKVNPDWDILWVRHFTGSMSQQASKLLVRGSNIYVKLACFVELICDGDTLWENSNYANKGIMQLDTAGNFLRMLVPENNQIIVNDFTFSGEDLVIYGECSNGSVGSWSIDNYFLGRYYPYPLGIQERKKEESEIILYPNPANDLINITSKDEINEIQIYSITGQFIKQFNLSNKSVSLDIKDMKSGNYIIKVKTREDIHVEKFIILR